MSALEGISVVLGEEALGARIEALADKLTQMMAGGEWALVAIMLGAMPFASDIMKALARRDIHPQLDALWLESYGDAQESSGRVGVRADISRSLSGLNVLLIDDVYDTGRTLTFAKAHLLAKGANRVVSCALALKPNAPVDGLDVFAFAAPDRFLVGYGMDQAGRYRGLPFIGAVDD